MDQLLCHLVGDYVLQNQAMADNKTSSWKWAAIHVAFYTLPFLLLTTHWKALAVISGTHLIIDRFRLARYWVAFWGIGCPGYFGRVGKEPPPPFLAVWLLILVDNTFHLLINRFALTL